MIEDISIPPEKALILMFWKDNPDLSFTLICKLLQLKDISIIANFFKSQKVFPDRPHYLVSEIIEILQFGFYKLHLKRFRYLYITRDELLEHIRTTAYGSKFNHFLSCFYKQLRPGVLVKCSKCKQPSSHVLYNVTFTPVCINCQLRSIRLRRSTLKGARLASIKYKKKMSKKGYTTILKTRMAVLMNEFNFMPMIHPKRIYTLKDCMKFYVLERYDRVNLERGNFRILQEVRSEKAGDKSRRYLVRRFHISRYREG